jgi:murein DD-endopeptidase MepM/ murein hydrolase activator NlpD
MSGGTSAGNIITEAAAVYAVRTWVNIAKVDELGVIADSQLDSIIAANWFNNVDDNLIQVNAWMNGTGVAPHTRATVGTIATLNSTVGNVTTVNTTTVNATTVNGGTVNATALAATGLTAGTAVVGSGAISDGVSTADDLVIGNLAGTDRGLTVLSTSVARLCFADKYSDLPVYDDYYANPAPSARRSQKMHGANAVDLAAPVGTDILASAPGTVSVAKSTGWNYGYGQYI